MLQFLIDNLLIDQYLTANRLTVDAKEVNTRIEQVKAEVKKGGQEFAKFLAQMFLTEAELRAEVEGALRRTSSWTSRRPTRRGELLESNRAIFDGSQMRVRHILIEVPAHNAQAADQARVKLALFRKQLENQAAAAVAKLPATADNLAREKCGPRRGGRLRRAGPERISVPVENAGRRRRLVPADRHHAGAIRQGGIRAAAVPVEQRGPDRGGFPFDPGDRRAAGAGDEVRGVRVVVRDVFTERLRELMVSRLRPGARITIQATK